jgi:phosphate starvation-inducible PhoH-like protein
MTITTGYPGTGKTYVPTIMAADAYIDGEAFGGISKIILTRPNEASGRPIGYRPGTMIEKMSEWFAEQLSLLRERMGAGAVDVGLKRGTIEMVPFETMRGRSFNSSFVLLDEAQNTTPDQMKMFVTRLGEDTTVVVNGDVLQSDLKGRSGLTTLLKIIQQYDMDVPVVDFSASDIVRSSLCKRFIVNWMDYEQQENTR